MLRSTENLILALRAINRGPTPRRYQPIDQPCDRCFKVPPRCPGARRRSSAPRERSATVGPSSSRAPSR